ncbi:MAG: hypothetical protein U0401_10810 [Anaerolineae bacterium]
MNLKCTATPTASRPDYDVELMKLMAADIGGDGVELDIQDQEFDGLIPALLAGKVDIISVGLVGRPRGRFGNHVVLHALCALSAGDGVPDVMLPTFAELNAVSKITALTGSTAAGLVSRIFPEAELVELQQQWPCWKWLRAGPMPA